MSYSSTKIDTEIMSNIPKRKFEKIFLFMVLMEYVWLYILDLLVSPLLMWSTKCDQQKLFSQFTIIWAQFFKPSSAYEYIFSIN